MKKLLLAALAAATLSVGAAASAQDKASGTITITVSKLRSAKGVVLADLFASEKGFPDEPKKALRNVKVKISGTTATAKFEGVPHGTYAISLMHDENDDGELESNWYGKPLEGVGTSNDAQKKSSGMPKFADATFRLDGPELALKAEMAYYD